MIHLGPGALISLGILLVLMGMIFLQLLRRPYTLRIALRFLRGHAKMNAVFICASCISALVITGSLIAGESLRTSITRATYENLGEVDEIITSDRFFNGSISDGLAAHGMLMNEVDHIVPLIYLQGSAGSTTTGRRTMDARIIGFEDSFLELGTLTSVKGKDLGGDLEQNEVYVNEEISRELNVGKGDVVNISFFSPEESFEAIFLGDRSLTNTIIRFEISDVVKDSSLGRFQLSPHRDPPENIYIPMDSLRRFLSTENAINTILVSNNCDERKGVKVSERVSGLLSGALDDVIGHRDAGLRISENPDLNYVKLESENVFLPYRYYEVLNEDPASFGADAVSPVSTYFWNSLSFENRSVPYSTVTAMDIRKDREFGSFTVNVSSGTKGMEGGRGGEVASGSEEGAGRVPNYRSMVGSRGGSEDQGSLERLEGNGIMLNTWTAERLQVSVGDVVSMNYSILDDRYRISYLNESFTVEHIVEMQGKAADRGLMPSFPGIEGKNSAFDWDPPFPLDLELMGEEDEEYWDLYGGTPKAFIGLERGTDLWGTDVGNITQIRFSPAEGVELSELKDGLEMVLQEIITKEDLALSIREVKQDALESADGIVLFTEMFLAFSGTGIVASALLLVLLVALRIDSRTVEIGLLRTFGFRKRNVRDIFLVESSILSIAGGGMGTLLGLLFGAFIITGLNSFWSPIVEDSAVRLSFTMDDLVIGFCAGCIISILSMTIGLHHEGKRTMIQALKRIPYYRKKDATPLRRGREGFLPKFMGKGRYLEEVSGMLMVVCALIVLYSFIEDGSVLVLFFVTGFLTLIGLLLVFHSLLMRIADSGFPGGSPRGFSGGGPVDVSRRIPGRSISGSVSKGVSEGVSGGIPWRSIPGGVSKDVTAGVSGDIPGRSIPEGGGRWYLDYAIRNAAREPKRTTITVILFSLTLFVLISLTANLQGVMYDRERAVEEAGGGYEIMGESTNPIFADLANERSREDVGIESTVFDELEIEQFRTKGDVGGTCSNLNRNADPRIIGAHESFFRDNAFPFVRHKDLREGDRSAWDLLRHQGVDDEISAIGDYNTVVWILGLELGSTVELQDEQGNTVHLKIVGIIKNSIFQGSLFIWDEWFESLYPTNPGYTLFLFKSGVDDHEPQMDGIEQSLAGYGFEAHSVESLAIQNIEVENTYISVFQVLLIFGVIIGTLGVGVVVSRNMIERQWEMGILRAIGITRGMLFRIILMENSFMIVSGMLIGTLAGVMTSWVILATLNIGFASWPWLHILAILLLTYGIALISVIVPIIQMSRLTTAETLRIFE